MAGGRPDTAGTAPKTSRGHLQSTTYGGLAGSDVTDEANAATQYGAAQQKSMEGLGRGISSYYGSLADTTRSRMANEGYAGQKALQGYGQQAYDAQAGYAADAYQQGARMAGQAYQTGNAAVGAGYRMGNQLTGYGRQAQGVADTYGAQAGLDYGNQGQSRDAQMAALANLAGYAQQGPGPSAAEQQLRMGADQNMAQAIALARSGRGSGNNAAAMRAAQFQNAATQQQLAGQTAQLRAQEAQAWRQQQLQALAGVQEGAGAVRSGDVSAMSQAMGAQGQAANLAQGYNSAATQAQLQGLSLQQGYGSQALQGMNMGMGYQQNYNQAGLGAQQAYNLAGANLGRDYTLGSLGAEQGYYQQGGQLQQGYTQMGQQANQYGQGLRSNILTTQLQNTTNKDLGLLGYRTQQNIADTQASTQRDAALIGGLASLGGAAIGAIGGPAGVAAGAAAGNALTKNQKENLMSDIRAKTNIAPAPDAVGDMFDKLRSYSYQYRDPTQPGAAPGTQYGPMAQELEQSPAGATAVRETPTGKAIDTGRLSLLNASATAEHERRLAQLERLAGGQ